MKDYLDLISLIVSVVSLIIAVVATVIANSSLAQATQVAERDLRDWRQTKWFDLYCKADEAYDALDRFQVLFPSPDSAGWDTPEWEREWHNLMRIMRTAHRNANVFPKNPEVDALHAATAVFKDMTEATSKERLAKVFDAVEGIRQWALIPDASILLAK